ncbi:MAG TPA: hypothetical protein VKE70_36490 [Candidatus Solibacter sp.]|nr:hypothetical protein [Candidatus Solibacter sp.]
MLGVVSGKIQFAIVVDNAEPHAIEPSVTAQKILTNRFIGEEVNDRFKTEIEHRYLNYVAKSYYEAAGAVEYVPIT